MCVSVCVPDCLTLTFTLSHWPTLGTSLWHGAEWVLMCMCESVQYMCEYVQCAVRVYSVSCLCFMDCLIIFLLCVPYPSTLSVRERKNREGEEGKCSWVFGLFLQRGAISLVKWHKRIPEICVLLSVSWQNIKIHRRAVETCSRSHRLPWDARNSSLKRSRVRVLTERARLCYLCWRCSVCSVLWNLCCRGCWWPPLWTDTSAEVSDRTEPHLQTGSANTGTSHETTNRCMVQIRFFLYFNWWNSCRETERGMTCLNSKQQYEVLHKKYMTYRNIHNILWE